MHNIIIITVFAFLLSCNNGITEPKVRKGEDSVVTKMLEIYTTHIDSLNKIGSRDMLDADFAKFMKVHLKTGNRLADLTVGWGKDETVKAKALSIRDRNQEIIVVFESYLSGPIAAPEDSSFHRDFTTELRKKGKADLNGATVDSAYQSIMADHHSLSILMADIYLKYAQDYERKNEKFIDIAMRIKEEALKM